MTKTKKRSCIKLLASVTALTVVTSMSICQFGYHNLINGSATETIEVADSALNFIGEDTAKSIALEDAGIQENDTKYVNVWLEYDNRIPQYYTVKFESIQTKYKYEIDMYSGEVLERRIENHSNQNDSEQDTDISDSAYIGENSAKASALEDAGIQENDTKYVNVWLEYDNKIPQYYEVEFESNRIKYSYEIDLYSGEVLEKQTEDNISKNDSEDDSSKTKYPEKNTEISDSAYIGEDSAKASALEDAGVLESDVKYVSAWFEYDKGQPTCYVVKFGLKEEQDIRYKYEIDLYSGEVLTKSTEYYGDVNSDGNVSISDAIVLQQYLLGLKSITKENYEVADINADGSVDVFDLVFLKRKVLYK